MAKVESLRNWTRTMYTRNGELLIYYNGYDQEKEAYEVKHVMKFETVEVTVTPEISSAHKTKSDAIEYIQDIQLSAAEEIAAALYEIVTKATNHI